MPHDVIKMGDAPGTENDHDQGIRFWHSKEPEESQNDHGREK